MSLVCLYHNPCRRGQLHRSGWRALADQLVVRCLQAPVLQTAWYVHGERSCADEAVLYSLCGSGTLLSWDLAKVTFRVQRVVLKSWLRCNMSISAIHAASVCC